MSECDPRVEEYLKNFGPKEMAEAILLILFEQKKLFNQLTEKDQEQLVSMMALLNQELKREDFDEAMVRGLSLDIKVFLIKKLNVPEERFTHQNLIQFRQARNMEMRKEHGVKEEFDPFAEPKKKEFKN